jgi:hypothetical protein
VKTVAPTSRRIRRRVTLAGVLAPLLLAGLLVWPGGAATQGDAEDSCVECHANADFLVTNKKLYDYFQDWELSVHKQEDVTCSDCHGGNPGRAGKDAAHGGNVGEAEPGSAVNFQNIPNTCGECHDDVYQGYRQSPHFEHLVKKRQEKQGPNCVTCHGSINSAILNVNTVQNVCQKCHNEETGNHPEIPEKAKTILGKFLSIHRFYRYIGVRGDPVETKKFFGDVNRQVYRLSANWHTFDIDKVEEETRALLAMLKERRDAIRSQEREAAAR